MRKSYKVGTVAFALLALGVAMTHASMTACTSKNTSPEPTAPAANAKSSPPPSAQPEGEYFPASKSGGFMPSERRGKK